MTTTATGPNTPSGTDEHITGAQERTLRTWLTDQLTAQRERVQLATEAFEALADTNNPVHREAGRDELDAALEAVAELEHSLERADEGSYGVCAECGKDIPFERLEAVPDTDYCVECAASY